MNYKRYHTALVMVIVLQKLLKGTILENKVQFLYADLIELERIPRHQIKSADRQAKRILKALNSNDAQIPSPFTIWQRIEDYIKKSKGR